MPTLAQRQAVTIAGALKPAVDTGDFTQAQRSGKMTRLTARVVKLVDTRDLKIEHREAKAPA